MIYLYTTKDNSKLYNTNLPALPGDRCILQISGAAAGIKDRDETLTEFLSDYEELKADGMILDAGSLVCVKEGKVLAGLLMGMIPDGVRVESVYTASKENLAELAHVYLKAFEALDDLEAAMLSNSLNEYSFFLLLEINEDLEKKYYHPYLKGTTVVGPPEDIWSMAAAEEARLLAENITESDD